MERNVQERLGSALRALTAIEERAASGVDPKSIQRLLKLCRQLTEDLEYGFARLQEVAAQQAAQRQEIEAASRRANLLFQISPLPCVVVQDDASIVDANAAAAALLNTSARHLPTRGFDVFVAENRGAFLEWLQRACRREGPDRWTTMLRPREQRPRRVDLLATLDSPGRVSLVLAASDALAAVGAGHALAVDDTAL